MISFRCGSGEEFGRLVAELQKIAGKEALPALSNPAEGKKFPFIFAWKMKKSGGKCSPFHPGERRKWNSSSCPGSKGIDD